MTAPPLLTAREAGAYLRRSRPFLTRHAAELGAVHVGSRLMFTQAGIDAYVQRHAVKAEPTERPAPPTERTLTVVGRGDINPRTGRPWDYLQPPAAPSAAAPRAAGRR